MARKHSGAVPKHAVGDVVKAVRVGAWPIMNPERQFIGRLGQIEGVFAYKEGVHYTVRFNWRGEEWLDTIDEVCLEKVF